MSDLDSIAEAVDALTNPIRHTERIFDRDRHRNKRLRRVWTTTHPSLLDQLQSAVHPGEVYVEDGVHTYTVPRPIPPARLEAINYLLQIDAGVAMWMTYVDLGLRRTTADNLRAMCGISLGSTDSARLLADLRRWYGWAATLTGWELPPVTPRAPCPVCGAFQLRVRRERNTAACIACGEAWTEAMGNVGVLAAHILTFEASPTRDTSDLRTAAVAARREEEAKRPGDTRPDLPYVLA